MPTDGDISTWHYAGFVCSVIILLGVDLGFLHKRPHNVGLVEALTWTSVWFALSMAFAALFIRPRMGSDDALDFVLGYIIELSLSMDNVLVMALIFGYSAIPRPLQYRVDRDLAVFRRFKR